MIKLHAKRRSSKLPPQLVMEVENSFEFEQKFRDYVSRRLAEGYKLFLEEDNTQLVFLRGSTVVLMRMTIDDYFGSPFKKLLNLVGFKENSKGYFS